MNTKFDFYLNSNGTPIFEIGYPDGEKYFLMPFRGVNFQVSMSADGNGSAGNSSNMYFNDVKNCMLIGMQHSDGYWVEDFPVTTMQNIIDAAARDALLNHFHCSYGSKHKESIGEVVNAVYSCDRNSPWRLFLKECYKCFDVSTKWD